MYLKDFHVILNEYVKNKVVTDNLNLSNGNFFTSHVPSTDASI